MIKFTLQSSTAAAAAASDFASSGGMAPISVAVIDIGGNLQLGLRQDGAGIFGIDIAAGKARAALAFGCSSRDIAEGLSGNPLAGQSVLAVAGGGIVLLPGGVLLAGSDGSIIGALGVAGDAPDRDEQAALAGAAAYR